MSRFIQNTLLGLVFVTGIHTLTTNVAPTSTFRCCESPQYTSSQGHLILFSFNFSCYSSIHSFQTFLLLFSLFRSLSSHLSPTLFPSYNLTFQFVSQFSLKFIFSYSHSLTSPSSPTATSCICVSCPSLPVLNKFFLF